MIQCRIYMIAGDIAHKKNNNTEAMEFYKKAYHISLQFGGEASDTELFYRLGLAYLANGDIANAEVQFNKVLDLEQHDINNELMYAKYGLACVAQAKGEIEKARQLAEDTLQALSRLIACHRLLKQIQDLLESLKVD